MVLVIVTPELDAYDWSFAFDERGLVCIFAPVACALF
jgi:hypothetical protein